ncbi:MAG: hypothetical protein KGY76_06090, partial [Candidatus Thermoplasmatota archaeon]|nr:hypothetical protein [Candidatus Thermoplasmatota archaeon]
MQEKKRVLKALLVVVITAMLVVPTAQYFFDSATGEEKKGTEEYVLFETGDSVDRLLKRLDGEIIEDYEEFAVVSLPKG